MAASDQEDDYDRFIRENQGRIPALSYVVAVEGRASASDSDSASGSSHQTSESGSDDSESDDSGIDDNDNDDDDDFAATSSPMISEHAMDKTAADVATEQTFAHFDDLKRYVESICGCKMSNNKRTTRSPPIWFRKECPSADLAWLSGTLYCHKPKEIHASFVAWAKTSCTCHARYVLCPKTMLWRIVSEVASLNHNHQVETTVEESSAAGLVHIRSATKLDQDMIRTIHSWFDARQQTKAIRFHFRQKYPNKDVKKKVIRSLRTQYEHRATRNNGMDDLLKQLRIWESEGGVGKVSYSNLEISSIQFQHPLIREVAKLFGVVSTVDGTHNTTKHEKSTLISCCCQDSFGSLCQSGASFAATESAQSIREILDVLGLDVETLITDASKASFAVVEALRCNHILCSYHLRKHLSTSLENVDAAERKIIWDAVMKCLKWQGFKTERDLVAVSDLILAVYRNAMTYNFYSQILL